MGWKRLVIPAVCLGSALVLIACGGSSTSTSPHSQSSSQALISVAVSPPSAAVQIGSSQQFSATVSNTNNTAVSWRVNGTEGGSSTSGTISPTGLYTAPANVPSPTLVTVTAVSAADATRSASAAITVQTSTPPVSVSVSPASATVQLGLTQQFTATVSNTNNTAVNWLVNGVAGGSAIIGTVSSHGLYSAPTTVPNPAAVTVTAVSQADPGKTGSAIATVGGDPTLPNLQASKGWTGYGEYPPAYNICTSCGPGVTYWIAQGIKSPSRSGNAAEFNIGGTTPYSDVLWVNKLIGTGSTQGLPDANHKITPNTYNFSYDLYFYGTNLELSQALEFDVNQYFNSMGFIWGTQCRIAGGNEWDIWDNINARWVRTGIACYPKDNSWNHVTIQVQRESDNRLLYQSITLNGVTSVINRYYNHGYAPASWYGITVNFQTDGNHKQWPYDVYLDNFNFSYW